MNKASTMSVYSLIHHFIVTNALTIYYNTIVLMVFLVNFLKNPFADPWASNLKLEPPKCLSDPKYGTHKYIKVNGIKLHYVESGDPSKPLMLFIHGYPEFWYSWRHQIVHFNKDYWCIAVDMRGYGDSERPEHVSSYKIELLVDDIRDLLRQLGRDKCILVSHDWGGLIACRFRDVYPECLSGLVLLASTSRESWFKLMWSDPEQKNKSWYIYLYRAPFVPERLMRMNDLETFEKFMIVPGKDTITMEDIECYKYWFRKQDGFTYPINYYRANISYSMPEKQMCHKNIPFLTAHAKNDNYLSKTLLDLMKQEYAHIETAIVENCSHFLQQEEPQAVNKLISDFLSKHNL